MEPLNITLVLGGIAVIWNIVSSILICKALQIRGQRVNFFLLRLMMPVYAHCYKRVTERERGSAGLLFFHWVISINSVLILAIVAIVIAA
jgi:hypothetical protein